MPRLAVISGKAGGLQAMLPMLRLFEASERWSVRLYLCDQHQNSSVEHPLPLSRVFRLFGDIGREHRVFKLSFVASHLCDEFCIWEPDLVIVYGDRLDALMGATVAHELRIPVAHLQAGDISGGIDNRNRYAISLLSRWLFCSSIEAHHSLHRLFWASDGSSRREDYNIHIVGDHHCDAVLEAADGRRHEADPCAPLIVHVHPDTLLNRRGNANLVHEAVECVDGRPAVYLPPCNDLHYEAILDTYRELGIQLTPMMPLAEFVPLLLRTPLFVGNSSALLIDAPTLGVPTMLLGDRQRGRQRVVGDGEAGRRTFAILDEAF